MDVSITNKAYLNLINDTTKNMFYSNSNDIRDELIESSYHAIVINYRWLGRLRYENDSSGVNEFR